MIHSAVIREPDDPIADVRISIGTPKGQGEFPDFYFVFRGDPDKVVALMKQALALTEKALPIGRYEDNR